MNLIEWPYYQRDYLTSQGLVGTFLKRFWEKVQITESCWIWIGGISPDGYGKIWGGLWKPDPPKRPLNYLRAHRAAWMICRGPIPEGLQALHNCPEKDNKLCVNPSHLFLGTNLENMADGVKKCQFKRGQDNHWCKLSPEKVIQIRSLYKPGYRSQQSIADEFGVDQTIISDIVLRKAWRHI